MAKILTFPNIEVQEQFSIEEDDKGFTTILNEHSGVKTLFERRHLYPDILEHKRENDAKEFLTDLLTNYRIDDETHEHAMALLEELAEDTTEFEYLF